MVCSGFISIHAGCYLGRWKRPEVNMAPKKYFLNFNKVAYYYISSSFV